MQSKHISLLIVLLLLVTYLSGCTQPTQNQTNQPTITDPTTYSGTIINEEFTIDEHWNYYQSPGSEVYLTFDETTVSQETTLTVKTMETFPSIEDAQFVVGYEFGPEGTQFQQAVFIQLIYDQDDVPSTVDEEELRIYRYTDNTLTEIEDCGVNTQYNTITGKIHHFCQYMICQYTPGGNNTYGSNHSAVYTFDVPLQLYDNTSISPNEDEIHYYVGAYVAWDPQPYVRYYELTVHFNGNEPEPYAWEKEYTEQGQDWGNDPWVQYVDNELLIIGDHEYYPGHGRYLTTFDNLGRSSQFAGKHGTQLGGFKETFYTDKCGWCYPDSISTEQEIMDTKKAMYAFAEEYFRDWTITVRPVT